MTPPVGQKPDLHLRTENGEQHLGSGQTKWLSNEVSSPFTGVVLGLYAQGRLPQSPHECGASSLGEGACTRFDDLLITYTY